MISDNTNGVYLFVLGLIMYVNDIMEGQSEVYVTLLNSRIGVRIRESYAYHVYQQQTFEESFGILDVTVSIPTEYFLVRIYYCLLRFKLQSILCFRFSNIIQSTVR